MSNNITYQKRQASNIANGRRGENISKTECVFFCPGPQAPNFYTDHISNTIIAKIDIRLNV